MWSAKFAVMVDKLAKALDGLKNLQLMTSIEEKNIR